MRLLLDSHVFVWWLSESRRLRRRAHDAIADGANDIFVSAASVWELEIKRMAGRLAVPTDLLTPVVENRFARLEISLEHGIAAGRLPLHHKDPFDRMLVAQAQLEGLTLVTDDAKLARYQVAILPA